MLLSYFSYFAESIYNTKKSEIRTIESVYDEIRHDLHLEESTNRIRIMPPGIERNKQKCHVQNCTFNGIFTCRNNDGMIMPSFLTCLDIDDIESAQAGIEFASCLFDDKELNSVMVYNSASWGVKLVIPVEFDPEMSYKDMLKSSHNYAGAYIEAKYGKSFKFKIDKGASALSKPNLLCHDDNAKLRVL